MSNFAPLTQTSRLYACSRTAILTSSFISFPALAQFHSNLIDISRRIGNWNEDSFWNDFLRPLRRYRFDICASPWTAGFLSDYTLDRCKVASDHIKNIDQTHPSLVKVAYALLDSLYEISESGHDPIIKSLQTLAAGLSKDGFAKKDVAVLIKESRLVAVAREALLTVPEIDQWPILVPHNLRQQETYDQIIVIGPPYWYPEHVFTAPRATSITILCYDWMARAVERWKPEPALINPAKGSRRAIQIRIDHMPPDLGISDDDILVSGPDIEGWLNKEQRKYDRLSGDDVVEARLLILEDEKAVFVEAEDDAKVFVIDLNEESDKRVKRIPYSLLEPEMYVLLRTSGGGDYVVPVADRLLGEQAEALRDRQHTWKARLRLATKYSSVEDVIARLKTHGSGIATYQNVRNWMSDRSIGTRDLSDFSAIMALVGLGEHTPIYWEVTKKLRSAHHRAGLQIRDRLLAEVNSSDLAELERRGFMEFTLGEQDAGSLTAYRIRSIAPRTIEVPTGKLDRAFEMESS